MKRTFPDIVTFIQGVNFLNDQSFSVGQLAFVKALYGLPLAESELAIYYRGTGRNIYPGTEERVATLIAGRRSGKTAKIGAAVATYEALRPRALPAGEEAHVVLIAPTVAQSRIDLRPIASYLARSKFLSRYVVYSGESHIKLSNGVVIGCHANAHRSVRGRTIIAALLDEFAFFPDGVGTHGSAVDLVGALLPGMVNVVGAKLLKMSTTNGKSGILWEELQHRDGLDFPVWQLATADLNPSITEEMLQRARSYGDQEFEHEFLAQFSDNASKWITTEVLDPCVISRRRNLPRQPGVRYTAALDPASRHSDFALAIVHKRPDGTVVVDRVEIWTGTKNAPLPFESVLFNITEILNSYGVTSVVGDQHYSDVIKQRLMQLGIDYRICNFGASTRHQIFSSLRHLIGQGKLELVDDPALLAQLRDLRELRTPRGQIDIRPSSGMRDDVSVAVALAVNELVRCPSVQEPEFGLTDITMSSPISNLDPHNCPVAANCQNFPRCMDEDSCLGYKVAIFVPAARLRFPEGVRVPAYSQASNEQTLGMFNDGDG